LVSSRLFSARPPSTASDRPIGRTLHHLRQAVVASGVAYAGAAVAYSLVRPLLGKRHGWIELADDLEPWAYLAAPVLGALGTALGAGPLGAAAGALAASFGVRWGHRYLRRTPDPGQASADLKVMTFNTLAWQRAGHDVEASIASADPDIVGLQEIGPNAAEYLATSLSDRFPYHYMTRSPTPAGAAVLSRYPLLDPVAFRASENGHWWQRMIVDAPFGQFTFFNIHTKIPHLTTLHRREGRIKIPINFHSDRRSREISLLVDMLDRVTGPVIVVGDFNLTEHSWDHRRVAKRLRDAYQSVGSGFGHSFPVVGKCPRLFPSPFPMLRLDYVWHSDHFGSAWAYRGDPGHSDHHPIIAGLRWAAEAREASGSLPLAASTV
jgi:endonuclease/exonuclease/phosphatase (EEP) superfamily protein YafD